MLGEGVVVSAAIKGKHVPWKRSDKGVDCLLTHKDAFPAISPHP